MQRTSDDIWISLGPADNDTLRHATVTGGEGRATYFRFDPEHAPMCAVEAGQDALVHFNGPRGFMQQPARITLAPEEGGEPVFALESTGEAVSAESREMFRVGVALADYTAMIAGEICKLADVSLLGLAFFSDREYKLGEVLETAFNLGDESYEGRCRVKSIKPTAKGARYGLLCMNGEGTGNLEAGLRKLTMDAQRSQLRRMSRAG